MSTYQQQNSANNTINSFMFVKTIQKTTIITCLHSNKAINRKKLCILHFLTSFMLKSRTNINDIRHKYFIASFWVTLVNFPKLIHLNRFISCFFIYIYNYIIIMTENYLFKSVLIQTILQSNCFQKISKIFPLKYYTGTIYFIPN